MNKVDLLDGIAFCIFLLTFPVSIPLRCFLDTDKGMKWAKSLPHWPRLLHWYITACGSFFWMPCPVCGEWRGGHEPFGSLDYGKQVTCRKH